MPGRKMVGKSFYINNRIKIKGGTPFIVPSNKSGYQSLD